MNPEPPNTEDPNGDTPRKADTRRSGCVGIVLEVASWVVSTLLITVGAFLLVFGVLDFSPEARARTLFLLVLVPVAIYVLVKIGRNILEDLRGMRSGK